MEVLLLRRVDGSGAHGEASKARGNQEALAPKLKERGALLREVRKARRS